MIDADICNMALGFIGKQPIVTLDDNTSNAIKCKLYYDVCRQQILRSFQWNFARRQEKLSVIDTDRKGWRYVYDYPENCLLAYRVFGDGAENAEYNVVSVNDNVKGIACQIKNAWIDYLYDVKDLSIYPPDLITAFTHLLASKVSIALAGSSATSAEQYKHYEIAVREAKRNAAIEQNSNLKIGGFKYLRSR